VCIIAPVPAVVLGGGRQVLFERHVGIGADRFGQLLLAFIGAVETGHEHHTEVAVQATEHHGDAAARPARRNGGAQLFLGLGEVRREVVAVDRVVGELERRGVLGSCNGIWRRQENANCDEDEP
jgi:hypothetical protein